MSNWTFRGSSYCQLIRQANKIKRLDWAKINLNDKFENIVWTDEATIQLETHRRFSCHKRGERPKNKPRYVKYSSQGISHFGRKVMLVKYSTNDRCPLQRGCPSFNLPGYEF